MRQTIASDHRRTFRIKLSHPDLDDLGEGSITFGYSCFAHVALDLPGLRVPLNEDQLAAGLLVITEEGTQLSLFNCKCTDRSIYPEFVVEGKVTDCYFQKFEVRYSNVSEWFFSQLRLDDRVGEEIKWKNLPVPLIANIDHDDDHFRSESLYVASIDRDGEDRNLHQHFEFRFIATKDRFEPTEIRQRALQFSNLLSILLTHPCSIVSVDVSVDGKYYSPMYYPIFKEPPKLVDNRVAWFNFFTWKCDVDDCWQGIVSKFCQSKYQAVIWSRLAGLQNYEGFWEYRVLGYVTLLDGYVSKHFSKFNPPTTPPKKKKLEQLENRLAEMSPPLNPEQQSAVVAAVTGIFSAKNMSFANKFSQLLDSLDKNVVKIINLTDDDFKTIKDLRNDIAHGDELTFKGPDFTPILVITSKITLLLTYLFFLDIGLAPDDFARCLSRGHNRLRMAANVDNVHLDRVVHPTHFFQVSSSVLASIRQRSTRLIYSCFVRDHSGDIAYSNSRSVDCEIRAARNGQVSQIHELLDLPKEAVAFYQKAYFEDGTQTEAVDLAIFINMDSN